MSNLNDLAKEIHENAKNHGWWDEEIGFPEIIALCHSELSEALEEYRNGNIIQEIYYNCQEIESNIHKCNSKDEFECLMFKKESLCKHRGLKPEGIPIELSNVIIRILDYCGKENIDIEEAIRIKHEYNKSREYRHGGKKI